MTNAAQSISVFLEYDDEDDQWTVLSVLIDDNGGRRLTTLARFPSRADAVVLLENIYASMPIQIGEETMGG